MYYRWHGVLAIEGMAVISLDSIVPATSETLVEHVHDIDRVADRFLEIYERR